jgi:uncharacterized membrane protein YfcA
MLAAISALVGLVAWWFAKPRRGMLVRRVCLLACAGIVVGSLVAIWNPPPFTKPALAPWIALVAGAAAVAALRIGSARRGRPVPDEPRPATSEGV